MKNRIHRMIDLPAFMGVCLILKFVVYYYLIKWSASSFLYVLISIVLTMGLYFALAKTRWKRKVIIFSLIYLGLSIFMFADVMYFNYYNQTVSIEQFWQLKNVAKVPQSFVATIIPISIFILLDIPVVIHHFISHCKKIAIQYSPMGSYKMIRAVAVVLLFVVVATNPFGNARLAKVAGEEFFLNHVNDVIVNTIGKLTEEEVEAEEVMKMIDEYQSKSLRSDLKGIAKGKNVILIQLEAFQNFVLQACYNGQELCPNFNQLLKEETIYFDHYYANIGKGNTADAEFTSLNSLYPVSEREVYTLYEQNTYQGLPWRMKSVGYDTFAVHGYDGEFWNRRNAYPYQGIDEYYAQEDLDDKDLIGLGVSDQSVFSQAVDIMKGKNGSFLSLIVTLTNHHPYVLDEELAEIDILEEDKESKFASYLQTIRYTDKAVGAFIEKLKENDLYENSILVFYGDHHGLNKDMDDNDIYMSRFLGREYDYDEMMKVPLIIHIPGSGVSRTVSTTGGQIDLYPTLANLLDIEYNKKYVVGQDLINAETGFVAFTAYMLEGSFVTDNIMYESSKDAIFENGRAWNPETGEEVELEKCFEYYNRALTLKLASKQILEQDLIQYSEE